MQTDAPVPGDPTCGATARGALSLAHAHPLREYAMTTAATKPMTAGNIAAALKVPPGQVKKAIATLRLKPTAKKGACSYYGAEALPRIKAALK